MNQFVSRVAAGAAALFLAGAAMTSMVSYILSYEPSYDLITRPDQMALGLIAGMIAVAVSVAAVFTAHLVGSMIFELIEFRFKKENR